jgi:hypothetical protein
LRPTSPDPGSNQSILSMMTVTVRMQRLETNDNLGNLVCRLFHVLYHINCIAYTTSRITLRTTQKTTLPKLFYFLHTHRLLRGPGCIVYLINYFIGYITQIISHRLHLTNYFRDCFINYLMNYFMDYFIDYITRTTSHRLYIAWTTSYRLLRELHLVQYFIDYIANYFKDYITQ